MSLAAFIILAPVLIISALAVILWTHPLASALSLIVTLVTLAVSYFVMDAPFIGILQILLYSGAIMVLFIFVIMLINLKKEEMEKLRWHWNMVVKIGILALFPIGIALLLRNSLGTSGTAEPVTPDFGSVAAVSHQLLGDYIVEFELVSFVILTAVIGAMVLVARERKGGPS